MPRRFGTDVTPRERPPVAWYAPPVLLQAGEELVQSQNFQRNLDRRESFSPVLEPIDLASHSDALGIDFVSDTGDGGMATFAVAQAALAARLQASDETGAPLMLPEGEVLVFGGDLAYPGASPAVYQYRFYEPWAMALDPASAWRKAGAPAKVVAAIPQNHDWFDSASTFCRYFVAQDKGDFLGARTPQRQTYFALRLPHHFWLLGFDWSLTGDLDRQQFEAFRALLEVTRDGGIGPGDDVLLLYPEPYWTRPLGDGAPEGYPKRYQRLEAAIEARGARIRLRLAGDLHHYHRETLARDPATALDSHLVTCGCGGAFLHPTHSVDVTGAKRIDRQPEAGAIDAELRHRVRVGRDVRRGAAATPSTYETRCRWPDAALSRLLAWRNLWALFTVRFSRPPWRQALADTARDVWHSNLAFALAIGLLYGINAYVNSFVFSWSFERDGFAPMQQLPFRRGAIDWLRAMVFSPLATGVNLLMLAGCLRIAWEGPAHWAWRVAGGLAHGFVHGFAIFALYWGAAHGLAPWLATLGPGASLAGGLASWALVAAGGVAVGGLLFGGYLAVMAGLLRQLPNNAFGSLALEGWKGFLRMRLTPKGLEVLVLGCEDPTTASRAWRVIDRFHIAARSPAAAPAQADAARASEDPVRQGR